MKLTILFGSMISSISLNYALTLQEVENFFKPATTAVTQFTAQIGAQATSTGQEIAQSFEKGKDWVLQTGTQTETAVVALFSTPAKNVILNDLPAYRDNPYKNKIAQVRLGKGISAGEQVALARRTAHVNRALYKNQKREIAQTPKIALIASGGGWRAMIYFLGVLRAFQRTGVLDMVTWMAGLSGSTWAMGTLLSTAQQAATTGQPFSLPAFTNDLFGRIAGKGLGDFSTHEAELMADELLLRTVCGQPMTLVNIYGALLANRLLASFGDMRHRVHLSEQAPLIESGNWPIPLYTAVRGDNDLTPEELYWDVFTPWEIGSTWLGAYTPTWGYGREFKNGRSVNADPEKGMGFQFGTFGSAFAAKVEDIYQTLEGKISSPIVRAVIEAIVVRPIGQTRLTWAAVDNFTRDMPSSPTANAAHLRMVDAGLAFNLPYPAVCGPSVGRSPDIIIIIDASYTIAGTPELKKTEAFARRNNLQFPRIDYTTIDKKGLSIFRDPKDPSVPVVIYMPRINDKSWWPQLAQPELQALAPFVEGFDVEKCVTNGFCDTMNFNYSRPQIDQLAALGEFNGSVASTTIMQEITDMTLRY